MTKGQLILWITLGTLAFSALLFFSGCNSCKPKEVAALLDVPAQDVSFFKTSISYSISDFQLGCLDSRLFELVAEPGTNSLRVDFKAISGHSQYGSYVAAIILVQDELAFTILKNRGCVDNLSESFVIDWETQQLVLANVAGWEGCDESIEVSVQEDQTGLPQVSVHIDYLPQKSCEFNVGRSIVVDAAKVKADLSVVAGCDDDNEQND